MKLSDCRSFFHTFHRLGLLIALFVAGHAAFAADQTAPSPKSPITAAESLEQFVLTPGLKIEIVASEPEVIDPVAIRFDEDGRLWVVEMSDYPHGPAEGEEPKSRIKVLEDRDRDGRFETMTVFADKLLFATGIQPWKGGVFVTLAGQVAYLKDNDGDGRADQVETWYTGFAQENSQLRANHPRLALDNHIYVANGLRGGMVVDARDPNAKPLSISGMDFRFDPLTGKCEAVSGVGQFGLTFDDWGNRFVCSNRNPLRHIVIENRYLQKNPLVAIPDVGHDVAVSGADSRIYPITSAWTTSNLHTGQFTAACGVEIFRGGALPEEFYGNAFTCDPTGHLVHREIMTPAGATFTSKPAHDGVEFLASRDQWFRPVNLHTGPDGALYVVDMYRAVIEHPQFMPDELKNRPDLLLGNDRGRIYRIYAGELHRGHPVVALSAKKSVDLLDNYSSTNGWWSDTTTRLLLERQDKSVVDGLEKLARTDPRARSRVHALRVLDGLNALSKDVIRQALVDSSPRVREHGVLLAERHLNDDEQLRDLVLKCEGDARLGFVAKLALAPNSSASSAWLVDGEDQWVKYANLIAAGREAGQVLKNVYDVAPDQRALWRDAAHNDWVKKSLPMFGEMSGLAAASGDRAQRDMALQAILFADEVGARQLARVGLAPFLTQSSRQRIALDQIRSELNKEDQSRFDAMLAAISADAADASADDAVRIKAIEILVFHDPAAKQLAQFALEDASQAVRARAIAALASKPDAETWSKLVQGFPKETPSIRSAILDGLLANADRTLLLLDEIAADRVKISEIDGTRINQLLNHRDAAINMRAKKLLASAIPADRQEVLADYQAVLKMTADPLRGKAVFKENCAQCHKVGDVGVDVAPDISDSRGKTTEHFLTNIIQPNRAIDANYIAYVVVTLDGRILTGVLSNESSTAVTMRQAENKTVTIPRAEIEEIRSTGISLMPDGLEKKISHQQMADVISFIQNWRYLDGNIPFEN